MIWKERILAKYLNSIGVAGIVLKYRLPTYGNCVVPYKAPLMDAQRAMRLVRQNAEKWNISPDKIGVMDFLQVAIWLPLWELISITVINQLLIPLKGKVAVPILWYWCTLLFRLLISCTHSGSEEALLGKNASHELKVLFSNELQVKEDTPPAFICQADNDTGVPTENSILMYRALKKKKNSSRITHPFWRRTWLWTWSKKRSC